MDILLFDPESVNADNENNTSDLNHIEETEDLNHVEETEDSEVEMLPEETNESARNDLSISNPTPSTSAAVLGLEMDGGNKLPKKKLPFMKKTKILDTPNFSLYIERTDFKNYSPLT